jgi:hypothetical protein
LPVVSLKLVIGQHILNPSPFIPPIIIGGKRVYKRGEAPFNPS